MPAMVPGPPGGAVLDGVLERVTFANPETGYTIARIAPERGADLITAVGPLVQPPEVRTAVRGGLLRHGAARHRRGHPEIPRLGPDQGHRPGHGRTHGRALRHRHHARHRRRARPADR